MAYKNSAINNYLEDTVYGGFATEVKNTLNNMNVISCNETIQRHVVAPSLTELGISPVTPDYGVYTEGTVYPIFSPICNPNSKTIYRKPNGDNWDYWSRSTCTNEAQFSWAVDTSGRSHNYYTDSQLPVVARIRFAKA